MYRRKVINVDLQKVFIRPLHENVSVQLDKELYEPTGILEIPPFNLSIDILLDANQDYHLVLKADLTLTLSDARTCKPVSYPVHLDFEEKICVKAFTTSIDCNSAKRFEKACDRLGKKAQFISTFGGSDNNYYANAGIDGFVVSTGMNKCHSTEEYTYDYQLENAAKLAFELMTSED